MSEPQKTIPKPRRWLRRLKLLGLFFAVMLVIVAGLLVYLYKNLTGVVVWFANRSHPRLKLELQHAGFIQNGRVELQNVALRIDKESDQVLLIEKAVVDFRWSDLWNHRIGSVVVENPRITVTDHLMETPAQSVQPADAPLTSADGLWRVDKFKITGGKARIDLARSPVIQFDFSSDMRDIYLSSEIKFSSDLQTVNVTGIEISSRDTKPVNLGSIKSITAQFALDHIAQNRIDEVVVQSPSVALTPALLAAFSGSPAGPESSATNASRMTTSPRSWVIDKLRLTGGEFFFSGFGKKIPEGSLKFAFGVENFQVGVDAGALAEKLHSIQLWDIRIAPEFARLDPFLTVGSIQLDFTSAGLFSRKEFAGVTVTSMDFQMGQKFRSFLAAEDDTTPAASNAQPAPTQEKPAPWMIRNLRIYNGRATVMDLGTELPNIGFALDTELKNVPLSSDIQDVDNDIQEVVIKDLKVPSPYDPFVIVLNFGTIRLRFSLAQILHQEIGQVVFEKPEIYISEQLFWYSDYLKKRQMENEKTPPGVAAVAGAPQPGWRIDKFNIERGKLILPNAGKAGVAVPLDFGTEIENLQFNNLVDLKLKVKLNITPGDYFFPSYQLEFYQLKGGIDFDLPPGTEAKNIVQTLVAGGAKWKQYKANQLWLSITYDAEGIYGSFGGAGYKGYVSGAFQFYMLPDTPWTGWINGTGIDLQQLTDIMAPQNFQMSGPADFFMEINGMNHTIERVTGSVKTKRDGKLKIAKLDQVIANIPPEWSSIKKGVTRIALETLRDFDYTAGNGNFWYSGAKGNLTLKMEGPNGSRNFDINLHSGSN